jgi:hypothetical protein
VCLVATTFAPDSGFQVVRISPISEKVKQLQVISCDICGVGRASFDVFIDGVISEVTILKRCCDKCVKSFSQ